MENDTDSIRKLGEKMMGGFNSPKSSTEKHGESKGMFEMPSFGGNEKQDKGMFEMPSFGAPNKQEPQEKSAGDMFGGGFGIASSEDSDKLKELGKRMMGQ